MEIQEGGGNHCKLGELGDCLQLQSYNMYVHISVVEDSFLLGGDGYSVAILVVL